MLSSQPAQSPEPLTLHLKFGHALIVIGARIGIFLLQILFRIWVALTPGLDRNL
jgi:hypothetical protein